MSLSTNLTNLVTRIGTEFKSIRTLISGSGTGDLSGLTTADTSSLVGAINELDAEIASTSGAAVTSVNGVAGPGAVTIGTDDVAEGVTNLYHTDARAIAAPLTGFTSGAGTVAATDSVLAAIQKIDGNVAALPAIGDTATPSATELTSTQNTVDYVTTAINDVIGGAGAAYDTLLELQNELTANDSDIANLLTAVGNRVRFDAVQTLTAPQKSQANDNLGLGTDIETRDFEADFVAALA